MRVLVAGLPQLEAVVAAEASHPFALFLALCATAGQLAALGGAVPPQFPAYDHRDVRAVFAPVLDFCRRMVDGVQESYAPVPFRFREGAFGLPLREEWLQPPVLVGVVAQPGMTEGEVISWMDGTLIGSRSRMASLRERRIRGVGRRRVSDPSREFQLAPGSGVLVFALRTDEDFIVPGEELEIAHPAPGTLRPREIVLYAPKAP
ncbi:MAG: type VI secretion system baseplate subunit TssK [Gemmatimonadetes bacterium]|nr:type VI secretion system baseplate subunit TssK [Gemmatimonadota bacterium]